MMMVVLVFQAYEHKRGRRYKVDSPMAVPFVSIDDAQARVDLLKRHATPSQLDRAYGAWPTSYDWAMYRLESIGSGQFAIRAGTTSNHVEER